MGKESTKIRLLNEADAAKYLSVSRQFLRKSRMDGHLEGHARAPSYVKSGRMVRYCIDDLDAWIDSHRREVK